MFLTIFKQELKYWFNMRRRKIHEIDFHTWNKKCFWISNAF